MEKAIFLTDLNPDFIVKAAELAPTAIFLKESTISDISISLLKESLPDAALHAVVDIFMSTDLMEELLEDKVVEAQGKVATLGWYTGVCPNNKRIRDYRLTQIASLASNSHISGIWLDALQFPTFWQAPEPEILDTCYCPTCIKLFIETKLEGDKLPTTHEALVDAIDGQYYTEWLEFKAHTISTFAKEAKNIIRNNSAAARYGLFAVPWTDQDYGTGNRRILGQSLEDLADTFDYITPMLYAKLLGKETAWIQSTLDYFAQFTNSIYPALFTSRELEVADTRESIALLEFLKTRSIKGLLFMDLAGIVNNPEVFDSIQRF